MEHSFNTLVELKAGISALKLKKFDQEEAIHNRFKGPGAIVSTIFSLFKSKNDSKSFLGDLMNQDVLTNLSRVILPAVLNLFVFKKSNFLTKTIVTFLSQKAAKNINTGIFTHLIEKAKDVIHKAKHSKVSQPQIKDYGIPPDSETY